MGLYDGNNPSDNAGSSYDLACKLDIPIILVVNAHGMGRSILAVIKGFQAMDEDKRIKGIILNNISEMFYTSIKDIIEKELDIRVVGFFPKMANGTFESRYLGLKMPDEPDMIEKIQKQLHEAAEIITEKVELDALLEIGRVSGERYGIEKYASERYASERYGTERYEIDRNDEKIVAKKVRIAVARDEAFCFYYEDNLELLERLGAEIVEFSPIHDTGLPDDIDGLILGGGYPELHAELLAANVNMREAIMHAIDGKIPSLAECGGFMYLHDSIIVDDISYSMVGAINAACEKKSRLVRFGYLIIEENKSLFFESRDKKIRGHEFHYFDSTDNGGDATSVKPSTGKNWQAAHVEANHWWGFAHLYYPSNLDFAAAFVDKCLEYKKRRTNKQSI